MTVLPGYKLHQELEADVKQFLASLDYLTAEATYHSVMPDEVKRVLQNAYSATALCIRGRADRVAVHKAGGDVFEWEAKTHKSRSRHDMTIEALPLCHHLAKARLDVECLYCYRNLFKHQEAGFWVRELPPIRVVMIPGRWTEEKARWFKEKFVLYLPGVDVVRSGSNRGSGDPFAIVDESIVDVLPHWQKLILERT